ncbi:hypothetical protein BH23PLA1_BH23PLA1_22520 [soil metagenome]
MTSSTSRRHIYSFSLTLAGADAVSPEIAEAFYATGANDATLASIGGTLEADFDREAANLIEAIVSAMCDVEAAGLSIVDVRVEET